MKLAYILILGVVGEVHARSYTLGNTTATTRSTVSFTATFRPAPTTTTTSTRPTYTEPGVYSDMGAGDLIDDQQNSFVKIATPEELGYTAPTVNYRTYESPEFTSVEQKIYSGSIDSTWTGGEALDASTYTNPYLNVQPVTSTYQLPADETLWATSPETKTSTTTEPVPVETTRSTTTTTYTKSLYE